VFQNAGPPPNPDHVKYTKEGQMLNLQLSQIHQYNTNSPSQNANEQPVRPSPSSPILKGKKKQKRQLIDFKSDISLF
jgi:hypothetical protein